MTEPATDLILLSGGLDSTTLLADRAQTAALALSVHYGQRHKKELVAAQEVAAHYGVEHHIVDLSAWGALLTGSALTDWSVEVPHGHYADESMRITVVPNRNAVMLMAAVGVAESRSLSRVLLAVHAGDHPIYPDCRPEFIESANRTAMFATDGRVRVCAPFVNWAKVDIAAHAGRLEVPVGLTWSCYKGGTVHCGRCGTCTERREAFQLAGLTDPTEYED